MCDKRTNEKFKHHTSSHLKIIIGYVILLAFIMGNSSYLVYAREGTVKVGVYDNPPILFKDDNGKYKGLSIEVLEYIASEEGWNLEYVPCSWNECLEKLEDGKIDLQVYIAFSKKRARKYDFTNETLFSNWGLVFSQYGSDIESILDLNQKTVALLKKAIHNTAFRELIKKLNIECKIIEVDSNHSVLRLLDEKKVDAGVVNRVFGDTAAGKYNINKTSIIFNPIEIRYAMPKGQNHDLTIAIDRHKRRLSGEKLPTTYNFKMVNKARKDFWVQLNTVIINWEGRPATLNFLRDITEQMELEAQLQQTQKMEAIATLAGGIAHEFNNALTSVVGNIQLLEMDFADNKAVTGHTEAMKTSSHRMVNLTSQLLAYARGGRYQAKTMSLSNFVEDTLPIIKSNIDPSIRLETDLPRDIFSVEADPAQMQMVLSAVVSNSTEAIEGDGRIRITASNEEMDESFAKNHLELNPGNYVCLTVEDDGKGQVYGSWPGDGCGLRYYPKSRWLDNG